MKIRVKAMMIKLYDYVNGSRVEEIKVIDGEPHYLIVYFDWGAKKPQSRWLPEHLVKSHVSAEDFKMCNYEVRGYDEKR